MIEESKDSPDPLVLTKSEVKRIFEDSNVPEEKINIIEKQLTESVGEKPSFVAANISKNTTSINEDAAKDYESAFALMYDFVDMFVLNVSCPNVVGLTSLQDITFQTGLQALHTTQKPK